MYGDICDSGNLDIGFSLSAPAAAMFVSTFRLFESLAPIGSGCGGAGRAGTGFLMLRPGSPTTRAGCEGRGGSECDGSGAGVDRLMEDKLAVDPLLFFNFKSEMLTLRSLFTDLRLHISGLGDPDFGEEPVLDIELEWK